MVDHWTELCFNSRRRREFISRLGEGPAGWRKLADRQRVLGLALPELRALMDGIVPISDEQLTAVAERLGVNRDALVEPTPRGRRD